MNPTTVYLIFASCAALLGVYLANKSANPPSIVSADGMVSLPDGADQMPTLVDSAMVAFSPSTYSLAASDGTGANQNISAFLDMLAYSEGTAGTDGYRTLFGGGLFYSYADHPRQIFSFTNSAGKTLKTSAAGRYQILQRTWDDLKSKLGLQDFSPTSQDQCAIELIRERGALNDVIAGHFSDAIRKCAPTWASLPGAGYDQPERSLDQLAQVFSNAGGQILA